MWPGASGGGSDDAAGDDNAKLGRPKQGLPSWCQALAVALVQQMEMRDENDNIVLARAFWITDVKRAFTIAGERLLYLWRLASGLYPA